MARAFKVISSGVILLFCYSFQSCEEKIADIPIIRTGAVTNIGEDGALLSGKITQLGAHRPTSYGFVWSSAGLPTINDVAMVFNDSPTEGAFFHRVSAGFKRDTVYYVRAFMENDQMIVYGDVVKFRSKGSSEPVVTGFEPAEGTHGSEIEIFGGNFGQAVAGVTVRVGPVNCEVLSAKSDTLVVRMLEDAAVTGEYPITVQIADFVVQSESSFHFTGTHIVGVTPPILLSGQSFQVSVNNLPPYHRWQYLVYGNPIYSEFDETGREDGIEVEVDFNFSYVGNVEINLIVYNDRGDSIGVAKSSVQIDGPSIESISTLEAFPGEPINITGRHLDKVNGVWINDMHAALHATSPSSASLELPYNAPPGSGNLWLDWRAGARIESDVSLKILSPWTFSGLPWSGVRYGAAFVIDNSAYFGLGQKIDFGSTFSNVTWCFNANENTWQEKAPFPGEARVYPASFVVQNLGYVLGGRNSANKLLKDFWTYDAGSNTWTRLPDFPGGELYDAVCFVLNGEPHVLLGRKEGLLGRAPSMWKYDPSNDIWQAGVPFPSNNASTVSMVHVKSGTCFLAVDNTLWRYTSGSARWEDLGEVSHELGQTLYFSINEKCYVQLHNWQDKFLVFDPANLSWRHLPTVYGQKASAVYEGVAFSVNNKGYILGRDGSNNGLVWEFDSTQF